MLERRIPSARFEYITASRQYLVTEISKAEATEPRHGKVIFRKFMVNILLHVFMFLTIDNSSNISAVSNARFTIVGQSD